MKQKVILIVEDEAIISNNILELLKIKGYIPIQAFNGLEALKVLELQRPDVIICDIIMPVMDGISFYKNMQSDSRFWDIPVIFLSAKLESITEVKNLGAKKFIPKPFKINDLLKEIEASVI